MAPALQLTQPDAGIPAEPMERQTGGRSNKLTAAGAVVFRGDAGARRVLLVHRPLYDDWTLPKGKPDAGEYLARAAVREVEEETGVRVKLGIPLGSVTYPVTKGHKTVHWWMGHEVFADRRRPDSEIDRVAWLTLPKARARLTWEDERAVIDHAASMPASSTLIVVRHGKAMLRKHWEGKDSLRPLNGRGRRQSLRLVTLLGSYGIDQLLSSSSTRCWQTFQPYVKASGLGCEPVDLLSEESAAKASRQVEAYMAELRAEVSDPPGKAVAVCGHRPVLPTMLAGLQLGDHPLSPGDALIAHLGAKGSTLALELVPSPL